MKPPVDGKVAQDSSPEGGAAGATLDAGEYRPRSVPAINRIARRWNSLSLERRFLIAAALSVSLSMLTLGYWIERQIRSGWLHGMAETGAVYLEALLSPHLQVLDTSTELPEAQKRAITALVSENGLKGRVAMIKIWDVHGRLLFSTGRSDPGEKLSSTLLARVRSGQVAVDVEFDDRGVHSPVPASLLEVYAPMYKRGTRELVAIGEFYEFSRALEQEARRVKFATWFLVINVGIVIGVLLFVTVRRTSRIITTQQNSLERHLVRTAALAKRNNILRRAADKARLDAAVLTEAYLARVGADLHDGPIQMLSLLMLKLPERASQAGNLTLDLRVEIEKLVQMTLSDLRNLSVGLVLPELKELPLDAVIDLVITRHEQQTGTQVTRAIGDCPREVAEAVKVCVYRIIQEGLTNAYKHAGGAGQSVKVGMQERMLSITVRDGGGRPAANPEPSHTSSLGLRGMESRVQSLRGVLSIQRRQSGGMEIMARLPVQP